MISAEQHGERQRREGIGHGEPPECCRSALLEMPAKPWLSGDKLMSGGDEHRLHRREMEQEDSEDQRQPRVAAEGVRVVDPELRQRREEDQHSDEHLLASAARWRPNRSAPKAEHERRKDRELRGEPVLQGLDQFALRAPAPELGGGEALFYEALTFKKAKHGLGPRIVRRDGPKSTVSSHHSAEPDRRQLAKAELWPCQPRRRRRSNRHAFRGQPRALRQRVARCQMGMPGLCAVSACALERVILGTRGSALALAQVTLTRAALAGIWPELAVSQEVFITRGDRKLDLSLLRAGEAGGKGLFTRELEDALLAGTIDVAVHSMKDLPGHNPRGLEIAAVLERAPTADVLITREPLTLESLPRGAHASARAVCAAHGSSRWLRPDLQIEEWRGNVPTRLRKLARARRHRRDHSRAGRARAARLPPRGRRASL